MVVMTSFTLHLETAIQFSFVLRSKGVDAGSFALNKEGDMLYVTASASDNSMLAFNPVTGVFYGELVVPDNDDIARLLLVGEDENVFVGTESMHVIVLSIGELLWTSTEQSEDISNYDF